MALTDWLSDWLKPRNNTWILLAIKPDNGHGSAGFNYLIGASSSAVFFLFWHFYFIAIADALGPLFAVPFVILCDEDAGCDCYESQQQQSDSRVLPDFGSIQSQLLWGFYN